MALFALLFSKGLSGPAQAIFGGYLVFWFAFAVKQWPTSRIRHDISYGLYLYGWVVGSILIWMNPAGNPWIIGFLTLAGSVACGYLSWVLVEGPAMDRAKKWLANRQERLALKLA
ncbi:hypothetical protein [Brevundimonas variabilis]|uniref:Peptidoglycan/LPS O-acetylase OafA/YrhL n=1 Tax=Brevundimonas variabilis TaxID=74312 RepID=A0A7W9FGD1_9CAUL|nr:hypothetical protein [Brevundimonas variabilis]MBB5746324.1 peptidoglycan/LPS O-acetylase OafA/YrhL [Brevundimonas variabilis]